MAGLLEGQEVRGPHLVLADPGDVVGVGSGDLTDPLDHLLRGEPVEALLPAERVLARHLGEIAGPGAVVGDVPVRPQRLVQVDQDLPDIADDRDVGHPVLGDLGRVDVGVDDLGPRGERVQPAGDPVVEAGAERDQQVGLLQGPHRGHRAVHAGHAEVERMRVGERATGHQRGDHRDTGELDQLGQLSGGVRLDHPTPDVEHRAAGLGDQPGGLLDLAVVRPGDRVVAGQVHLLGPAERGRGLQGVLGDVHQHRARTTGLGDVERLLDRQRDVLGPGHQEAVLGHRHRDAADVGLLEGVRADHRGADLAGDRDHRHRVHHRVGDRRDQVGRPGARGHHADPDPTGRHRVSLGCVPRTLLVAAEDVADLPGVQQRVVRRQDGATGEAENDVYPDVLQRADERLGAGQHRCGGRGGLVLHGLSTSSGRWFVGDPATKNPRRREACEGSVSGRVGTRGTR
ncbi:hypothetical protein SDC9_88485 [bioreactor metagenome]|uniref:Uncharacterized protein n=1 Tax=bioreactor metagenome TaxID=1076179 RepID=A0A644ZLQ9_9ZZZZ